MAVTKDDIEKRMLSGEPFTYGDLCEWRGDADHGCIRPLGYVADKDRVIDTSIQRLRRRGLIAFKREGGRVVWTAVADAVPS